MQKITLYRYIRPDGGVTISTEKPDVDYTELYRLFADEGMILTDGSTNTFCIDTDNPNAWSEVKNEENFGGATEEDYQNALREMGVAM